MPCQSASDSGVLTRRNEPKASATSVYVSSAARGIGEASGLAAMIVRQMASNTTTRSPRSR